MIALLMAAQVAAAQPAQASPPSFDTERSQKVFRGAPVCRSAGVTVVDRDGRPLAHNLGAEPKARLELTVLRTVNGCVKPVIVRYNIGP